MDLLASCKLPILVIFFYLRPDCDSENQVLNFPFLECFHDLQQLRRRVTISDVFNLRVCAPARAYTVTDYFRRRDELRSLLSLSPMLHACLFRYDEITIVEPKCRSVTYSLVAQVCNVYHHYCGDLKFQVQGNGSESRTILHSCRLSLATFFVLKAICALSEEAGERRRAIRYTKTKEPQTTDICIFLNQNTRLLMKTVRLNEIRSECCV